MTAVKMPVSAFLSAVRKFLTRCEGLNQLEVMWLKTNSGLYLFHAY